MTEQLELGQVSHGAHLVVEDDLALNWGGDVPVFASPVLIGFVEKTCVEALDGLLPDGFITVGVGFDFMHLAPAPLGDFVQATVKLDGIHGKQLKFSVSVRSEHGLLSSGSHIRAIVSRRRFMEKLESRQKAEAAVPVAAS
ncbi:MAG: hypothetical protein AAF530_00110 [Pseudomonadota bacterium]